MHTNLICKTGLHRLRSKHTSLCGTRIQGVCLFLRLNNWNREQIDAWAAKLKFPLTLLLAEHLRFQASCTRTDILLSLPNIIIPLNSSRRPREREERKWGPIMFEKRQPLLLIIWQLLLPAAGVTCSWKAAEQVAHVSENFLQKPSTHLVWWQNSSRVLLFEIGCFLYIRSPLYSIGESPKHRSLRCTCTLGR